ncbi:hypothetical protein [Borrelia anserina]|nr:hypothetical protein [Borrelia anserina]
MLQIIIILIVSLELNESLSNLKFASNTDFISDLIFHSSKHIKN